MNKRKFVQTGILIKRARQNMTEREKEIHEYIRDRYLMDNYSIGSIYLAQEVALTLSNGEFNPRVLGRSVHKQIAERHDIQYYAVTKAINYTLRKNNRTIGMQPYDIVEQVAKSLMYPEIKNEIDEKQSYQDLPNETMKFRIKNDEINAFERLSNYLKDDKIVIESIKIVPYGNESIITCIFRKEK